MFRMLPRLLAFPISEPMARRAVLAFSGWRTALSSTGAATELLTPAAHGSDWPRYADQPRWDLVAHASELRRQGAQILYIFGEVMDFDGRPVPDARIDIWQAGPDGTYRDLDVPCAGAFRGFGSVVSDALGHYMFRTILPVAYDGRAPHIHARVTPIRGRELTTQIFLVDSPENARDWFFGSLGAWQQAALSIDPAERPDGDLEAGFNFVI